MLNKIIIVGRVEDNPEFICTVRGTSVCKFSLKSESPYKADVQAAMASMSLEINNLDKRLESTETPEKVITYITDVQKPRYEQVYTTLQAFEKEAHEEISYLSCNVFSFQHLAETCFVCLARGDLVLVEGRLQTNTWKDRFGREHCRTEIKADYVDFLDYRNLARNAFRSDGEGSKYVPDEFKTYEFFCSAVFQHTVAFKFVPEELKTEKLCLTAVRGDGMMLQYVPTEYKTEEICLEALTYHTEQEYEVGVYIDRPADILMFVPDELKTEKLCLATVRENGNALQHVPYELRTKEICHTAVRNSGYAIKYVPEKCKTHEICLDAAKFQFEDGDEDGSWIVPEGMMLLKYVPDELKTVEFCLDVVRYHGKAIKIINYLQYIPDDVKKIVTDEAKNLTYKIVLRY